MQTNRTKSTFEAQVGQYLEEAGIGYKYEEAVFPLSVDYKLITYTPDFVLERSINSKTILLEPHGFAGSAGNQFDDTFFDKLYAFKHSEFKDRYYLVIITDIEQERLSKLLYGRKMQELDLFDEIWFNVGEKMNMTSNNSLDLKIRQSVVKEGATKRVYRNDTGLKRLFENLKRRSELEPLTEAKPS